MITSLSRKAMAVAAGASLLLGAAACSDDAADQAKDAASSATAAAGDAADAAQSKAATATDQAGAKASEAMDSAKEKVTTAKADALARIKGESVETTTADGEEIAIPADTQTAWDNEGGAEGAWGKIVSSETNENGDTLTIFENGNAVVYSETNGAVSLVGKINETWQNGGGLANEIGLPTAPEKGNAESGWTQSFTNGQIEWSKKDGGDYTDTITRN